MRGDGPRGELLVLPDSGALARFGAGSFVRLSRRAVERTGRFTAVLTGGGSPLGLYRLLATEEFAGRVPWGEVHLFWGDERCVPPDHPRSNFRMAREAFLERVPIPSANLHRIPGERGAARGAREYEAGLRDFFGADPVRFDLVHLGVGEDGHVASLFPFDLPSLLERERCVVPSLHRALGEPRVSLSVPALASASRVEMLFTDARKAAIARRVVEGPLDPLRIPAQLVRPVSGKVAWLVSRDAARNLRANEGSPGAVSGTTFA